MKRLFLKIKESATIYDIVVITLIVGALVATGFNIASHQLLAKSFMEFIDSSVFYGKSIFSTKTIPNDNVSFLEYNPEIIKIVLPIDIEAFWIQFLTFFEMLVNKNHIKYSFNEFGYILNRVSVLILLIAVPLVLLGYVYYNFVLMAPNDYSADHQSKPLKIYLFIKEKILDPAKQFIINTFLCFRYTKFYFIPGVIIILYNANLISFAFTFIGWYLYFVFSIDLVSIYHLFVKFVICISPLLMPGFWVFWIIAAFIIITKLKLKKGYNKLYDMYAKNDDFISDLGIVTGIYGVPGSGKNLLEVAIATQKEVQLREQACNDMMEIRLEFPDFPFRLLEEEVEKIRLNNSCVNKVQVKYHFKKIFETKDEIYGYDLTKNKSIHYDKLKERSLVNELLDYAQLYFIYISSLACSTYSLRYDKGIELTGCFPVMTYDFFHRDFRNDERSERAKIFDLNLIRLLKQVEDNKKNNVNDGRITLFDFGLLTLSEFGKDRGNRYTNQFRKDSDVKPVNDGTASCFGVLRHLTTVRYHQYGFVIWDEQKLSSFSGLEAAMAETNIFINKQSTETKTTLPLWFIEGTLLEWGYSHFVGNVDKYIRTRNDQTLYSYFTKRIAAFFANINRNLNNTFGYRRIGLSLSGVNVNGAQEGRGDHSFYLLNKIVFSDRYQTDCYSGFFDTLKLQADKGINQLSEYSGIVASVDELLQQHGYFAGELITAIQEYIKMNMSKKENGS